MFRNRLLFSLAAMMFFTGLSIDTLAFFGLFNRSANEEIFRVGFLPSEDSVAVGERREILANELSETIGMKVETIIVTDYNAAVEGMANGHVDLMVHGPFSYIIAAERAGAEAIAVPTSEPGNPLASTYNAVFIANNNSGIEKLEDIKGRSFAFVDPASASGNLFPRSEIIQSYSGITNEDLDSGFFSETIYSGSHDNSILSVVNGDVEAAGVASGLLERAINAGLIDRSDFKVIHRSRPIPQSPWTIVGNLDEDLKMQVRDFILNFDNEEYFTAAHSDANTRFVEVEDSAYDVIRDTAKVMGIN